MAEDYRKLKPLGVNDYLQWKADSYHRGYYNTDNYNPDYVTHPDKLTNMSLSDWLDLNTKGSVSDPEREWFYRLGLNTNEIENYYDGKVWDIYKTVFQKGLRQDYDLSINGGSNYATYYWSIGYNNYEGIRVRDKYSVIRTRLNVDFKITDWLNAGVNAQFSHRDEVPTDRNAFSPVPALDRDNFWANSPLGTPYYEDGVINRQPHGHAGSMHPLVNATRGDVFNVRNNLFASFYASIKLPFGINYRVSFQPRYETRQWYEFFNVGREFGVPDPAAVSEGRRRDYFWLNWMVDNVLSWKYNTGGHNFDVTLLANTEKNQSWNNDLRNKNFAPSQALSYHGLEFGTDMIIGNDDSRSTGAAYAARLNYNFRGKYLLNATIRRDGYSAFGQDNPWAIFPAVGVGWMISEEDFFKINGIDRLKLRVSYGVNGNRNIGGYEAIAHLDSQLWYDGRALQTGIFTNSLSNRALQWEKITSFNPGFDLSLLRNRIDLSFDVYTITTTNLLLRRRLSRVTGFDNVMANIGQLDNFGIDFTLKTVNVSNADVRWNSTFIFSMNRNKVVSLYDDVGTYTLLNKEMYGEQPDIVNGRFIGEALDVVWNYNVLGIWQTDEKETANKYRLEPGDYKVEDVERVIMNEGTANEFYALEQLKDKQFIGHDQPRYRLGFQNDVTFLKHFTASVFLRAELGHIRSHGAAFFEDSQYTMRNRACPPGPYWTEENPHKEYPRINMNTTAYGGGLSIYKPSSYLRVQDISLTYNMPRKISNRIGVNSLQVYGSIRNLLTFTKYPGWDPESGNNPMPRIWTLGVNFTL
jgi:TonB-linked SusC/RagA family outer membrane protein